MAGRNELDHLRRVAEDALHEARVRPRNRDGHPVADMLGASSTTLSGQLAIAEAIMYHAEVLRSMGAISEPRVITNIVQNETQDWVPPPVLGTERLEDYI